MDYLARGMASCFSFLSISYVVLRSSQDCKDITDEKGKDSLLYGFYWKEQHYLSPQATRSVTLYVEPISHITGVNSQQDTKSKVQHHLGVRLTLNDGSLFDSLDFFFQFSKAEKSMCLSPFDMKHNYGHNLKSLSYPSSPWLAPAPRRDQSTMARKEEVEFYQHMTLE